jgi:hypothetical protein
VRKRGKRTQGDGWKKGKEFLEREDETRWGRK